MTADKSFKRLVRQRMTKTGQSYAAARQSLRQSERSTSTMASQQELYASMAAMQATIREFLTPVAEANNKPLDPGLVSAILFDRVRLPDGTMRWHVDLYTMSPGLVLGPKGETANVLRAKLVEVTADANVVLNLVDMGKLHDEGRPRREALANNGTA